jgi:hypothetical protein
LSTNAWAAATAALPEVDDVSPPPAGEVAGPLDPLLDPPLELHAARISVSNPMIAPPSISAGRPRTARGSS